MPSEAKIQEKRQEKFALKVKKALTSEELESFGTQLDALVEETGRDMRTLACALASIVRGREPKIVPMASAAASNHNRTLLRGGRHAVLRVDIGRSSRVSPALLAGVISKSAGLPLRAVGAIDIHDDYTLIEMHESDALEAVEKMTNVSVGGRTAHFSISGEQLRAAPPHRLDNNREKPAFRDKPRGRSNRFDRAAPAKPRKFPREAD